MIERDEFKTILEEKKGPNLISDVDGFYNWFRHVGEKTTWTKQNLAVINQFIRDGMGPLVKAIFKDKLNHPEYEKYYGTTQYKEAPTLQEMYQISQALKSGGVTPEELLSTGTFKTSSMEEFSTTDKERKIKEKIRKQELMEDLTKSQKTTTKIASHKSKR
jgi:hypothetical protein